jgi:predicted AAA+ superfamily ATPase
MENLIAKSLDFLAATPQTFERPFGRHVDWTARLIGIRGARGVGKSTLIRQHLKEDENTGTSIYLSLDDPYFTDNSIEHTLDQLRALGYTRFYLDEVHRLPGWASVVKSFYDRFPKLSYVFSGSSVMDMQDIGADLSRRAVMYDMPGLSFREYLVLKGIAKPPILELDKILSEHAVLSRNIGQDFPPLAHFYDYLKSGYYPFFTEGLTSYHIRLSQSIRTVIESDMASIEGYDVGKAQLLLKLLYIIAGSVPFKPNISLLAKRTGLSSNTVVKYLHYLERARILSFLWAPNKGMSLLQKPDKVYLENSNLAYALRGPEVDIGSVREVFFQNQVSQIAQLHYSPDADFAINERYLIEIGGPSKKASIKKDYFIAKDGIDHGAGNVIPLWLFGLLY